MKKIFWGLFLIIAGIFLLLDQIYNFTDIKLAHLILTIFLSAIFLRSLFRLKFAGIFFPIAILCIIYSDVLALEKITPWPVLLTALLLSVGLSILFHKHCVKNSCFVKMHNNKVIDSEDKDEVEIKVSCGTSIKYINSENFKNAKFSCRFGELKVYFDNTKMAGNNAIINLDLSFAGVELFIPKDWKIINKVDETLSGIDEKNSPNSKASKTLTLIGKVSLSGVTVTYI